MPKLLAPVISLTRIILVLQNQRYIAEVEKKNMNRKNVLLGVMRLFGLFGGPHHKSMTCQVWCL